MKKTTLSTRSVKPTASVETAKPSQNLRLADEFAFLRQRQPKLFHLAWREAEALAWQTAFPQLVFPELAAEKLRAAARWQARQDALNQPATESAFAA